MQLALKASDSANATLWQRVSSAIIRARLVSRYSHGGVVINGDLYHATASRGLHCLKAGAWSPEKWDIYDLPSNDQFALSAFKEREGAGYDWFGLLAFVGASIYTSKKLYCFEWCLIAAGRVDKKIKATPELLLIIANGKSIK